MNFQKILSLLLCGCFLLGTGVASVSVGAASEKTYSLAEHTDKYKTQGRTLLTNDGLLVDWSASGIEFEANCSGDVYLDLNVEKIDSRNHYGCYFTVIVDGTKKSRKVYHVINTGKKSFKIASGLSSGKHTFQIYRQTQIDAATTIKMSAIRLTGELLSAPAKNDMYIEFVGDSITVGNGNLIPNGQGKGEPEYMDATQSYGYLTAKSLGADYSLVAISGIGASVGWTSYNMQTVYPKLRYPKDNSTNYDFARKPDVVVLALGTNDYQCRQTYGKTWDDIKAGFASTLNLVRQKNPGAKVIWIHGMMTTEVGYLIEEVIQEAGGAAKGLYALQLDKNNAGGNGHPLASAHKEYAKDLTKKIQSLFPKPTTTSKTTTTNSQITTKSTTSTKTTTTTTTTTSTSSLVTEFEEPSVTDGVQDTQTNETTVENSEQGTTLTQSTEGNVVQSTAPVSGTPNKEKPKDNLLGKVIAIVAAAIVVLGGVAFFIFKKVKK